MAQCLAARSSLPPDCFLSVNVSPPAGGLLEPSAVVRKGHQPRLVPRRLRAPVTDRLTKSHAPSAEGRNARDLLHRSAGRLGPHHRLVQHLRRLQPLPRAALSAERPPAAPLHPGLARIAFLLGTWRGTGVGGYPTLEHGDFRYGQEISFYHAGKPVLAYASRTWALEDDVNGNPPGAPLAAETGWWRPQPDGSLEVLLAHPFGIVEIYVGEVTGVKIELTTDAVVRSASAKEVTANHRLYGLVEGELMYAVDMAAMGQPLQPHLSGRLTRVSGG